MQLSKYCNFITIQLYRLYKGLCKCTALPNLPIVKLHSIEKCNKYCDEALSLMKSFQNSTTIIAYVYQYTCTTVLHATFHQECTSLSEK